MDRGTHSNGSGIIPSLVTSSRMDVPRKGYQQRRWRNRVFFVLGLVLTIGGLTF